MRILFFIFIFISSLYAKELKSCYTIQLISTQNNTKNKNILEKQKYPKECIRMDIADETTLRCGCYEKFKTAQQKLPHYKEKFKKAYIATSYKFRFKSQSKPKQIKGEDKELKLMLQTFLYSNDLDDAYKTAKIGYKKNPQSYYWNQKMAEISRWTGRSQEAMKYMKFMYKKKHDSKLAQNIIDYGLSAYQYDAIKDLVVDEAKAHPTKTDIDKMVYIYSQIGEPEKATKILHELYLQQHNIDYLTKELQIYMDIGDLEAANGIINIIKKNNLYTYDNCKLISYYYFSKGNISEAYNVFTKINISKKYDKDLYESFTDLGWYLQKYKRASAISRIIIKNKDGRLVDYERVINTNKDTNSQLALNMSLEAYKKFHHSYLYYSFAQNAIKHQKFDELKVMNTQLDKEHAQITTEANYWLIQAQLYNHFHNTVMSRLAIEHAINLDSNNLQVKFTAIDFYVRYGFYKDAQVLLQEITDSSYFSANLYFPVASLYYAIHKIDLASFYMNKALFNNDPIVNNLEFKFLQAELYRARFNTHASINKLREILVILKKQAKQNPAIKTTDTYQYNYLRASIYTSAANAFEQDLAFAKKYMTKAHYDDMNYAWAVRNHADEKAHKIFLQTQNREIWLRLSNALQMQEHNNIEDLLFHYLDELPVDDASYAADNDGQVSLAQSLTYKSLNTNSRNQNAYTSLLDLSKKRSDLFDSKISYYNRDPLLRKYVNVNNKLYINDGLYLSSKLDYYLNTSLDNNVLINTPSQTVGLNLGLTQLFNKGKIAINFGYANNMASYYDFSLMGEYRLNKYFTLKTNLAKNITADESMQLLLGGKKDMASFGLTYNILNSTALKVTYNRNAYTSQDNVKIGTGNYITASLSHQIRNGYPDINLGLFTDYGSYSENSRSKGVINRLQNTQADVLPKDFYDLGVNFSYGMQNSKIYTRVWRPYFELSSYYNSELQALSYGLSGGYGGKIYTQDHLVLSAEYTSDVNGIGGSIFEIFLRYEFLYTH